MVRHDRDEIDIVMEAIPDAIVAVDSRMRVLFNNSHVAPLMTEPGLPLNATPLERIFGSPEVLDTYRTAIGENRFNVVSLALPVGQARTVRDFTLSVTPLRREAAVYGAVGVFHDVTELKQAERIRIDFVGNVSHELRTPLTAIKGYTETLTADVSGGHLELVPRYLEIINRNVDRLMFLIEDLLDLSSLESGVELARTKVQTRDLTTRVLTQLEQKRVAKDQHVETSFKTEFVQADPRRVEQVLVNLIDNALKYVQAGGKIRVCWEREPGVTILRVIDNGPGVAPEDQQRLFERFYRVDKARSRELGGTGLGLAIVKHIMQRHGGSVRVRSVPGHGTEFICEFPDPS